MRRSITKQNMMNEEEQEPSEQELGKVILNITGSGEVEEFISKGGKKGDHEQI